MIKRDQKIDFIAIGRYLGRILPNNLQGDAILSYRNEFQWKLVLVTLIVENLDWYKLKYDLWD